MSPLSIRAPPSAGRGPKNLSEFIARMQALPGGFRAINQEELHEQVAATQTGEGGKGEDAVEDEDIEMGDADGGDSEGVKEGAEEAGDDVMTLKDLMAKRDEIYMHAENAHQQAMNSLDFISLLLSKETPHVATETLSQGFRSMVGIGTLGATLLEQPTSIVQARVGEFKEMEIGQKLLSCQSVSSNFLAAAGRLRRETGTEQKYWNEVTEVGDKGWSIFRMPSEPHTMGVKFGFSSATWFDSKINSVAPMERAEDGSVQLKCGHLSGISKRLQVTIIQDDEIIGWSTLPEPVAADAPLNARIQEARDSIFAQELWHELYREARGLLAHGVFVEKDIISYKFEEDRVMRFQLVKLGDEPITRDMSPEANLEYEVAESVNVILQLMLNHAHRTSERKPTDLWQTANDRPKPPLGLLAPIVTYLEHEPALRTCVGFFSSVAALLRSAGITSAACKVTEPRLSLRRPTTAGPAAAAPSDSSPEALVNALRVPTMAQIDLVTTPETRMRIRVDPSPEFGTRFLLGLLPPPDQKGKAADTGDGGAASRGVNPLMRLFPPVTPGEPSPLWPILGFVDFHYTLDNLMWYVENALPRALVARYMLLAETVWARKKGSAASGCADGHTDEDEDRDYWILHTSNKAIRNHETEQLGVRFDVKRVTNTSDNGDSVPGLELHVYGDYLENGKRVSKEWVWPTAQGGMKLDTVVMTVFSSCAL